MLYGDATHCDQRERSVSKVYNERNVFRDKNWNLRVLE